MAGITINPAAFTHTAVAILDALKNVKAPIIELHISNLHQREALPRVSFVTSVATATMCGRTWMATDCGGSNALPDRPRQKIICPV